MSIIPKHKPELVEHLQVAEAQARASGFDDPVFSQEMDVTHAKDSHAITMLEAIRAGVLKTRNYKTGAVLAKPNEDTLFHFLHPDDVNKWFESLGLNYRYPIQSVQTQAQTNDTKDTEKKWTDERKQQARTMLAGLKASRAKDYAAQTAKAFSVSTARLRVVLGDKPKTPKKKEARGVFDI